MTIAAPIRCEEKDRATVPRVRGRLSLTFSRNPASGRTELEECTHEPPLRVIRAFEAGPDGALVHIHNVSGGLLGGDRLETEIHVGPAAFAQVTSTGATRVYRPRMAVEELSEQRNEVTVDAKGLLEYLPDPLIPFADSRYRQHTTIALGPDAGLFWWDTVAPGRAARGESFAYKILDLRLQIRALGLPIATEQIRLEPRQRSPQSMVRLGKFQHFTSFYICRVGIDAGRWMMLEDQLSGIAQRLSESGQVLWGVSTLAAHGLIVRGVSYDERGLVSGLPQFWHAARIELYGAPGIPPRKVN